MLRHLAFRLHVRRAQQLEPQAVFRVRLLPDNPFQTGMDICQIGGRLPEFGDVPGGIPGYPGLPDWVAAGMFDKQAEQGVGRCRARPVFHPVPVGIRLAAMRKTPDMPDPAVRQDAGPGAVRSAVRRQQPRFAPHLPEEIALELLERGLVVLASFLGGVGIIRETAVLGLYAHPAPGQVQIDFPVPLRDMEVRDVLEPQFLQQRAQPMLDMPFIGQPFA